jgi:hypothetical protein
MVMTEHETEELKTRVIGELGSDPLLNPFWSGRPECDVFPYQQSDYLKELLVTVFLKESVINRDTVARVVNRIVEVVRPQMLSVQELGVLAGWIGGGDNSDRYYRVLRFALLKEALESPTLQSLAQYLPDEYFSEGGVSFLRYCPL